MQRTDIGRGKRYAELANCKGGLVPDEAHNSANGDTSKRENETTPELLNVLDNSHHALGIALTLALPRT